MKDVDSNAPAVRGSGMFGLDCEAKSSRFHVYSVPFEATTSFRQGTARGPLAILHASHQVELLDLEFGRPCEAGIAWMGEVEGVEELNRRACELTSSIRNASESNRALDLATHKVNEIGAEVNALVKSVTHLTLESGKVPVILGGDHSVPFGAWSAATEAHPGLGLLHFDAHADLRSAYEDFTWSHASVVGNAASELDGLERIVQVGIRDICDEELSLIAASEDRVRTVFDHDWAHAKLEHQDLAAAAGRHIAALPDKVWITFDIDGLDPTLCPNTGTPVPGGLDWRDVAIWLNELMRSGKRVVGIDLVEVAPGYDRPLGEGWDEIVGARLLYRLLGAAKV